MMNIIRTTVAHPWDSPACTTLPMAGSTVAWFSRNAPKAKAGGGVIDSSRAVHFGCELSGWVPRPWASDVAATGLRIPTSSQPPSATPAASWTQVTHCELDATFGVSGYSETVARAVAARARTQPATYAIVFATPPSAVTSSTGASTDQGWTASADASNGSVVVQQSPPGLSCCGQGRSARDGPSVRDRHPRVMDGPEVSPGSVREAG